jgi:hypothetical protein
MQPRLGKVKIDRDRAADASYQHERLAYPEVIREHPRQSAPRRRAGGGAGKVVDLAKYMAKSGRGRAADLEDLSP